MAVAQHLAPRKFFYGWYIVAVAFLAQMISSGYNVYAPSVLMKPMVDELGWNRAMFAGIMSLAALVGGFLSPFIGPLLDRRGARGLMIGGAIIVGLGFITLGRVGAYWQFALVQGFLIPIGFLGISTLAGSVAVANWFVRGRGRALALAISGLAAGNFLITPLTAFLVAGLGWRNGATALGILAWAVVILPAALIMRRRPEDVGLHPDGGDPPSPAVLGQSRPSPELTWTRRQAMGTRALWLLTAAFALSAFGTGGLLLHLVSYFSDGGLKAQTAATIMAAIGVTSMTFRVAFGFILDRASVRHLAAASLFLHAVAVAILLVTAGQVLGAIAGLFFMGLGIGINLPAQEALWANYYGRRSLGRVRSLAMPFTQVASAAGASFSGLVYTIAQSYAPAFGAIIAGFLMAAGLLLLARPPRHPAQRGQD